MERLFGQLIIVSPDAPHLIKFRFTRTAITILVLSFVISFSAIVFIGYTFPPLVTDRDLHRLEVENQQLKVRNRNVQVKVQRLDAEVSTMEDQSRKIERLASTE